MRKRTVPEFGRIAKGQTLVKGDTCNGERCGQQLVMVGGVLVCPRCDAPHPHDVAATNKQAKGHEPKEW